MPCSQPPSGQRGRVIRLALMPRRTPSAALQRIFSAKLDGSGMDLNTQRTSQAIKPPDPKEPTMRIPPRYRRGAAASLVTALLAGLTITAQPAQAHPASNPQSTPTGAEQQQQRQQKRFGLDHTTGRKAVEAL